MHSIGFAIGMLLAGAIQAAAHVCPAWYVGHRYAWTFPTLEGSPASVCPSLGRAPRSSLRSPVTDTGG